MRFFVVIFRRYYAKDNYEDWEGEAFPLHKRRLQRIRESEKEDKEEKIDKAKLIILRIVGGFLKLNKKKQL